MTRKLVFVSSGLLIVCGFIYHNLSQNNFKKITTNNSKSDQLKDSTLTTVDTNDHKLNDDVNSKTDIKLTNPLDIESETLLNLVNKQPQDSGLLLKRVFDHITNLEARSDIDAERFVLSLPDGLIKNSAIGHHSKFIKLWPQDNFIQFVSKLSTKDQVRSAITGLGAQLRTYDNKVEVVNWYINNIKDVKILSDLNVYASRIVFRDNYEQGKTWLLSLDSESSAEADLYMIRTLGAEDTKKAINLLQAFIDGEKFERFDRVAAQFVKSYGVSNPLECAKWTASLPDEIPNKHQLITNAFNQLGAHYPEEVKKIFESVTDPKIREKVYNSVPTLQK